MLEAADGTEMHFIRQADTSYGAWEELPAIAERALLYYSEHARQQSSPFNTGTFQVAPSTTRDVLRHQLHSGILIIVAVIRDWRKPR